MEMLILPLTEVFLGFSMRFLSMALVHAILKLKLGNPHPIWAC